MKLMPDPPSAVHRPVLRADHARDLLRRARAADRRGLTSATRARIAGKAQAYLQQTGIGDVPCSGPEAEFFVFDDVRFAAEPYNTGFKIDSAELPTNTDTEYEMGNLGHRHAHQGRLLPGAAGRLRRRTCAPRCCR